MRALWFNSIFNNQIATLIKRPSPRPCVECGRRQFGVEGSQSFVPSFGFSGAGFLGCYHVGAAACLLRQGWLPSPDERGGDGRRLPSITGVSAGSMIAAAIMAGVNPDPDGMEVVLEAARLTRNAVRATEKTSKTDNQQNTISAKMRLPKFGLSMDVFTPGFSLIDQVETPFREAMVKTLGGTLPKSTHTTSLTHFTAEEMNGANDSLYDIDPELFRRRFPSGKLRIGLADRHSLWLSLRKSKILEAYRYVDDFRNLEDVVASCMLSSYIPGGTGPLKFGENMPGFLGGISQKSVADENNTTVDRAGERLREMKQLGLVKYGLTGEVDEPNYTTTELEDINSDSAPVIHRFSTDYWDGGLVDVFPTFDESTVIVTPVIGLFDPNPAICPLFPSLEDDENAAVLIAGEAHSLGKQQQEQRQTIQPPTETEPNNVIVQNLFRSYFPSTFRHCAKSRLGINSKNVSTALRMMFSSEDDELYRRFREGYDDTKRFLDQRGQLRVFVG